MGGSALCDLLCQTNVTEIQLQSDRWVFFVRLVFGFLSNNCVHALIQMRKSAREMAPGPTDLPCVGP